MNDHNADECKRFAGEREACPFCGENETVVTERWSPFYGKNVESVECKCCGAMGPFGSGDPQALWQARAAQPAPVVPEGWRLVPVEPTTAMVDAGLGVNIGMYESSFDEMWAFYEAMLSAAPDAAQTLPVAPDDLRARCVEIREWQRTGVMSGNALINYTAAKPYAGEHNALHIAEADTAREAFELIAATPAQGQQVEFDVMRAQTILEDVAGIIVDDATFEEIRDKQSAVSKAITLLNELDGMLRPSAALKAQQVGQEPVAIANKGDHAFWVKWTDAGNDLRGPGIKLYTAPQPSPAQDVAGLVEALKGARQSAQDVSVPREFVHFLLGEAMRTALAAQAQRKE